MPGYTETNGRRLIPAGRGHQIYSITSVEFGTTDFYGPNLPVYEYNTIPFAISVKNDGVIELAQTAGTESLNPADTVTRTLLTIQSYKTWTTNSKGQVIISKPITAAGGGTIKVKAVGQTVVLDTTPPTILAITPSGSGISVGTDVTITLSESILRGASGTIQLWNETLNTLIESFNVASAPTSGPGSVAVNLNQFTLDPSSNLPSGCQISVRVSSGAIKDLNNNGIAAVTGSSWSFTTQPAVPVSSSMAPDVTVSSVASINSILTSWAADPVGTAPAGKTAYEPRVIGLNSIVNGMTISNKNMPMLVFIRLVGVFGSTSINGWNEPSCSNYVNGVITLSNNTNIALWRMEARAVNGTTAYNSGLIAATNCTGGGIYKTVVRGWPHQLIQGTYGTTATGIKHTGCNNFAVEDVVCLFIYDSNINAFGTSSGLIWRGNMGRHSGGNNFKIASFAVTNDHLVEGNYEDKYFHPYKSLHGDWFQVNNNPQVANDGGVLNRITFRYNVGIRGHWTGQYNPNTNGQQSDVTQFVFCSPAESTSVGPHLFEENLVVTAQQRGVSRISGTGVLTTRRNTMLDGVYPTGQNGQSPFPRIVSTDISSENFITAPAWDPTYLVNEGTNGIRKAVSADRHEIADEHMAVPTDLTSLWQIRPRSGQRTDPFYATPSQRVGCYGYWTKMYLGDSSVLPSKRGWSVDRVFVEDFDPNNNFAGTFTGNYDSNGDAI